MFDFVAKLFGRGSTKASRRVSAKKGGSAREQALAQIRSAQSTMMTPERAELLRHAMEVRRAKQKILADLSDQQRQQLAATAIRAFLNEARDEKPEK